MANWYGTTRTNYFRVKDEARYQELYNRLGGEEEINDFTHKVEGETWHGFGSYCDIGYYELDEDGTINYDDQLDITDFFKEISKILEDDSCFVMTCVGNEKLRYLTGICFVVFPDGTIKEESLDGFAFREVREYFGGDYSLYLDY